MTIFLIFVLSFISANVLLAKFNKSGYTGYSIILIPFIVLSLYSVAALYFDISLLEILYCADSASRELSGVGSGSPFGSSTGAAGSASTSVEGTMSKFTSIVLDSLALLLQSSIIPLLTAAIALVSIGYALNHSTLLMENNQSDFVQYADQTTIAETVFRHGELLQALLSFNLMLVLVSFFIIYLRYSKVSSKVILSRVNTGWSGKYSQLLDTLISWSNK